MPHRRIALASRPWFNPSPETPVLQDDKPYTFDRVVRMVLGAATLVALLALLRHLSDVLIPFAAAVVLAYMLNPLVTVFERKIHRRGLAVLLTLVGLGIVGMSLSISAVFITASQVGRFSDDLRRLRDDLKASMTLDAAPQALPSAPPGEAQVEQPIEKSTTGWSEAIDAWREIQTEDNRKLGQSERFSILRERVGGTYVGGLLDWAAEYVDSDEFNEFLVTSARNVLWGGWTAVAFVVNLVLALTGLIIVVLYLVFLLIDFPEYSRMWREFLPPKYRDTVVGFLGEFDIVMRRYFRGQFIIALLMGLMFSVGFSIIGLPLAVPLGLFIGALNMVPYLQAVGLVPAIILAAMSALQGDTGLVSMIGWVLVVFVIAQLIQDALIVPRIMGKATGLKPVAILLGVFIWGKLLGFLGLILAIPLTCVGIAYYQRYILKRPLAETRIKETD